MQIAKACSPALIPDLAQELLWPWLAPSAKCYHKYSKLPQSQATTQPLAFNFCRSELPCLPCLGTNDKGETYYSALARSRTACNVLEACPNLNAANARPAPQHNLVLAFRCLHLWSRCDKFVAQTATAAGQGEISLALALAMGLLGAFTLLHGAVQFQGVLPLPGGRRACCEPASTACWSAVIASKWPGPLVPWLALHSIMFGFHKNDPSSVKLLWRLFRFWYAPKSRNLSMYDLLYYIFP